jgi:type IV secretory pathway TraG/TraD family ATPase VirD4
VSNHLWKVYLPGSTDPETLSNLSKRIGTYTRVDSSISASHGSASETTRWVDEAAATVEDLQALPAGTAIVTGPRRKAIAVTNTTWFQNPADRALIDPSIAAAYDDSLGPRTPAKRR